MERDTTNHSLYFNRKTIRTRDYYFKYSITWFCKICISLLFVSQPLFVNGQEIKVISDFRTIGEICIQKGFFDKIWEIGFNNALRFDNNSSRKDEVNFDFFTNFKPFNLFYFGAGYRVTAKYRKIGGYELSYQYNLDIESNTSCFKSFDFSYRTRYQNIDDDIFEDNFGITAKNILRNRLQIEYAIQKSKYSPFWYFELFNKISSYEKSIFKFKTAFGTQVSFGRFGKVKIYYRIDRELNKIHPYTYYNLCLGYYYEL
jgi:hypothetical protein